MIAVPARVMADLFAAAREAYPQECCGALLGRTRAGDGVAGSGGSRAAQGGAPLGPAREQSAGAWREVVRLVALPNAWDRTDGARERRYLIAGETVLALDQQAEREGLELIGFYHSHPDHPPVPSAFDREHAWPWYTYVIVAAGADAAGPVLAWHLAEDRSAFEADALTPLEEA